MSDSKKIPQNAASGDDPWEQLAEDLFGLEYGKEHASSGETTESAAPAPGEDRGPEPGEPAQAAEGSLPFAETPLPFAENTAPTGADSPYSESDRNFAAPASPTLEAAQEGTVVEGPIRSPAANAQDSYWDALANWSWDEGDSPGAKGRRGERSRSRGERASSRAADRPSPSADVRAERSAAPPPAAEERGDFGSGVGSDSSDEGTPQRSAAPDQDIARDSVPGDDDDDFGTVDAAEEDSEGEDAGAETSPEPDGEGAPQKTSASSPSPPEWRR